MLGRDHELKAKKLSIQLFEFLILGCEVNKSHETLGKIIGLEEDGQIDRKHCMINRPYVKAQREATKPVAHGAGKR